MRVNLKNILSLDTLISMALLLSILITPNRGVAQTALPVTRIQALSHLHKLEVDRKNGLDRLIAISTQLTRVEFLHSLAQLRPPRLNTFTKTHLQSDDPKIRRASYYALATMSTINPMSWIPQHLNTLPQDALDDRIALCESLSYSLHPSSSTLIMQIYASDKTHNVTLLDSCITSALYWVSLASPLFINLDQAQDLSLVGLRAQTEHGTENRALHLIALLTQSPSLINSPDREKIFQIFTDILRAILKSKVISKHRYALTGLSAHDSLGLISGWWGIGQLTSQDKTAQDSRLSIERQKRSARLMGSEEASPLSPIILQKYFDALEEALRLNAHTKIGTLLERSLVQPYLILIGELLYVRRLPKTLAIEARRGIRLLDQLMQQSNRDKLTDNQLIIGHLKCHLSALVDHSLRRLQLLPKCTKDTILLPIVYQLSRRTMTFWGAHLKTKAIKSIFALHSALNSQTQWGLEILAQALLDVKPIGKRRPWMLKILKRLITFRSLVAQAAIEVIAEHKVKALTASVLERLKQAITYDEYAVISLGLKCLEILRYPDLDLLLLPLLDHPQTEISMLAQLMYERHKKPKVSPAQPITVPFKLEEDISPSWSKPAPIKTLTLKLKHGTIKMRISPHAFMLLKTLELALHNQFFSQGVVTRTSETRVTFSTQSKRQWTTWIYPPRSELSEDLNPKYLHDTWVLSWDPLAYDHFNQGWVFSKSIDALALMKHGVIAEVYSGEELLETALVGDKVQSVTWSTQ